MRARRAGGEPAGRSRKRPKAANAATVEDDPDAGPASERVTRPPLQVRCGMCLTFIALHNSRVQLMADVASPWSQLQHSTRSRMARQAT